MKKIIQISVITISLITIMVMLTMVAFAFNSINQIPQTQQSDIYDMAKLSDSDTQNGVTVSVESVYGGNDTIFIRLKVEADELTFDDNFEYSFLRKIDFKANPSDLGKKLINGGGTSRNVDEELWTENIRYIEMMMTVKYEAGVNFSLGDGQERVLVLEFFQYYDNEKIEHITLNDGIWRLKLPAYDTDDKNIDINFEPFMFYGKGLTGQDRLAEMTSIRLSKYSMDCRYTAYEVAEAIDFSAYLILRDDTKIALIRRSSACGRNYGGDMTFRMESPVDLDEIVYIQIDDEIIAVNN